GDDRRPREERREPQIPRTDENRGAEQGEQRARRLRPFLGRGGLLRRPGLPPRPRRREDTGEGEEE
ncbi:MAG TPA: hypothetical protein VNL77_17445, partial [Roseiflexaceae bacterium]|nr:hypothetical protein [Roseiflexaceae bacterium]